MSLDFSGLTDLAKKGPQAKPGWEPLKPEDLGYGSVLCFDQSLTATGCVILQHTYPGTNPVVYSAIKWADHLTGNDVPTSLKRGVNVYKQARVVIQAAQRMGIEAVVHESPPNPAAVKGGGTSSLMAAQAIHCAAYDLGIDIEMLGAQPGKKLICGNANAKKPEAHAVLKETVLPWIVNSQQITNEATRDALMVGLLWLARRK